MFWSMLSIWATLSGPPLSLLKASKVSLALASWRRSRASSTPAPLRP